PEARARARGRRRQRQARTAVGDRYVLTVAIVGNNVTPRNFSTSGRGPMIKLTITEKGGEPKALSFDKDEISIGRVAGNDIVLPKGNVSKRHSKIVSRDGAIQVTDLKSTNGTYVNGRKIGDPVAVTPSDKIYVGDFMIVLDNEMAASAGNGHSE